MAIFLAIVVPFILGDPVQLQVPAKIVEDEGFTSKILPLGEQSTQVNDQPTKPISSKNDTVLQAAPKTDLVEDKIDITNQPNPEMASLGKIVDLLSDTEKVTTSETVVAKQKQKQKQQAQPKPSEIPTVKNGWVVQAGVFSDLKNAQSIAKILRSNGFDPNLTNIKTDAGLGTRVWMGPFASKELAKVHSDKVKQRTGNSGYVAPFPFES